MAIRLTKALLILAIGLEIALAALDNLCDYESNFVFVQHVLSMDTTFPDNRLMWRSITSPTAHHVSYAMIIATECLSALLCIAGGIRLLRAVRCRDRFELAKPLAVWGLLAGLLLWLVGFIVIGGGWFLMWQSETYNGQPIAFRFVTLILLSLIFLSMPDTEPSP